MKQTIYKQILAKETVIELALLHGLLCGLVGWGTILTMPGHGFESHPSKWFYFHIFLTF